MAHLGPNLRKLSKVNRTKEKRIEKQRGANMLYLTSDYTQYSSIIPQS